MANYLGRPGARRGAAAVRVLRDPHHPARGQPAPSRGTAGVPGRATRGFRRPPRPASAPIRSRSLKLKWAFGFDGDVSAYSQPTVLDGHLFVGSAAGLVHAMRADSGCLEWTFQANGPVRAALLAVPVSGRHVLLFGDMTGWFYALQAETGALLWKVHVEEHDSTRLTAAATAHDGVVYVPVSSWEEARAADAAIPVLHVPGQRRGAPDQRRPPAVEDVSGRARRASAARRATGVAAFGPSGVGVWSTPTVDAKRGRLYVAHRRQLLGAGHVHERRRRCAGPQERPHRLVEAVHSPVTCSAARARRRRPAAPTGRGRTTISPRRSSSPRVPAATCSWRDRSPASSTPSTPTRRAPCCGRRGSARAAPAAACSGAWPPTAAQVYAATSDMDRMFQNRPLDPQRFVVDRNAGGGVTALRIADGTKVWSAAPIALHGRCAARLQSVELGGGDGHSRRRVRLLQRRPRACLCRVRRQGAVGLQHDARLRDRQWREGTWRLRSTALAPSSPAAWCSSTPVTRATAAFRATCCSRSRHNVRFTPCRRSAIALNRCQSPLGQPIDRCVEYRGQSTHLARINLHVRRLDPIIYA